MSFKLPQFKVAVPKIKRPKVFSGIKRITNEIIKCKVFQDDDGIFKVCINMKNDTNHPDFRILEFTERSYDLKGKTNVFSKTLDKKGRRTRFIRNPSNAKYMPGLQEQYIPFAPKWTVRGYIVNDNGITKFDFKSLVGIEGYTMSILHPEDD